MNPNYVTEIRHDLAGLDIAVLDDRGISAVTHYVPLHLSPAGRRFGRPSGRLEVTERVGESLLRLPLFAGMTDDDVTTVTGAVMSWAESART